MSAATKFPFVIPLIRIVQYQRGDVCWRMHQALCIDEILQVIFDICLESEKKSLCCLARCCKAWKDPALDRIWGTLLSIKPLLTLIPDTSCINRTIVIGPPSSCPNLTTFYSYARRVKRITCQQNVTLYPSALSNITGSVNDLIPNLAFARIDANGWGELQTQLSTSTKLRTLELDLGFNKERVARNAIFAVKLLTQVVKSTELDCLSIRGTISDDFIHPLKSLTFLRSLTLHVSNSLTANTLMTVSTLPNIIELDIQAGKIDVEQLSDAICAGSHQFALFPSLQNLRIRAHSRVADCIIRNLPSQTLRTLRIDAAMPAEPPSAWSDVFRTIAAISSTTLHDLTIEHSIDELDLDDTQPSPFNHFRLDDLRPLYKLPLKRFILDTLAPPDLADCDIEELAKWWPLLEKLELGAPATSECLGDQWQSKITISTLAILAQHCRKLEHLVVNMNTTSTISLENLKTHPQPHPLRQLTIGSHCPQKPHLLFPYIDHLFPSLVEVHSGIEQDNSD
ncbi:hypothetical protein BJ138DRAFT_1098008 [Hygrophoropsis aurantiaca]|uniref:Uncharacterized protein n=1 Tax=Hygrophoropsis aurantiaca TaxID=72124 RepID=A0ACB8AP83_9AGAM|nr:hypothetical protein BJ138DRAFT_1098008 [Hygrophoropsis aurantiaca]